MIADITTRKSLSRKRVAESAVQVARCVLMWVSPHHRTSENARGGSEP